MKKNNLLSGAFLLSVGGVLSKIFSAVYRIALTRILGGEGIGIYQLIFPFYSLCVVLATAGLPMAISKVIAKNKGNEKSILKRCFLFTNVISLVLVFILLISAKGLATLQGNSDISLCYIILAPTIILVSVSSVLRGYFQGKHNFAPSMASNIIEQFIKMVVGLVLSVALLNISLIASIIGAVVGIVISEIVSLVVLLLYFKNEKIKDNKNINLTIKEITKDIIPITFTNIILPISSFIDSIIVVNLLSVNFSNEVSIFLYGLESGAVSTIVSLPTIFSFAIASVILPNLTGLTNVFNKNNKLSLAIKTVLIITIPCVICFTLIPDRLLSFLYANKLNGFGINGLKISSQLLVWSGFGIVFMAINQLYSSALQAVEERYVTIRNLTIAVILKFVIQVMFMPSKHLNILALAIANSVCYVTMMLLNHMEIKQNFKIKINYLFTAKLLLANCLMIISLLSVLVISYSWSNTLLAVIIAVSVYFISLIKLKILNRKDMAMLKYKV